MRFEKWQALGNDYLIVEHDELPFELTPARVRRLCEGHFGVYADGVLELSRPKDQANVADLRIFNPDGTEAELSGNGAREAIMYLRRHWTDRDEFSIHTARRRDPPADHRTGYMPRGHGRARASPPRTSPADRPTVAGSCRSITRELATLSFQHVSIGNPQCAIHVTSSTALDALDLAVIGPQIEGHERFPNRTNVSWYTEIETSDPTARAGGRARIRARIFERGVGETLSSGTGATGAAVAYLLSRRGAGEQGAHVTVVLDGGELEVEVGEDLRVNLTGWARPVFEGRLSEDFEKELNETE